MHTQRTLTPRQKALALAAVAVLAAGIAVGIAYTAGNCVVETRKEDKDGLKILHFRNTCKFPVWAIIKNRDSGAYAVHRIEPGEDHEDPGLKLFPEVVGWCRTEDRDCLREYGMR